MNPELNSEHHVTDILCIIGKPLSPDRVFDFLVDELELHPAYDFFAPGPLPRYAGNPNNNNNGWLEADDYLLVELEVMADEPMVGPMVDEITEQMIVPVVEKVDEPMVAAKEQMVAPVIDMEEDLIALFGADDDFEDDDSEGFNEEEVWEVNEEWLMAPVTPPPMLAVQPPSVYEVGGPSTAAAEGPSFPFPAPGLLIPLVVIENLSTRLGNLEYGHGQLLQKVIQVSDVEVEAGVTIGEIGPRVFAIKGQDYSYEMGQSWEVSTLIDRQAGRATVQLENLDSSDDLMYRRLNREIEIGRERTYGWRFW
ncbi:hypothetical protein Tco_0787290 [Tanacetum coccineum]